MDLGLGGCVALVGGSSSGIGAAVARDLAAEGCRVVLFARRGELLNDVANAIERDTGSSAVAVQGDSSSDADLGRWVEHAHSRFGRLDILVNNTGGPPAGDVTSFDDAQWQRAYDQLVLSSVRATRHALPMLRASGRGRVITITSSSVLEPSPGLGLSNSLRAGVTGWSKTLAREEGPNGITVNCVAPGYIGTERLTYLYSGSDDPAAAMAADAATVPARRFGEPAEIAAAVTFLASTRAAYISGTTTLVDGGYGNGLLS